MALIAVKALLKLSEHGKKNKFSDLKVVDVLVAEFRVTIEPVIPEITDLLSHGELNVRRAGADALSRLSEHGNILSFLT